jgi:alcohol dehydrogenase class IV
MSMNWNYPTTIWFGDQRINEIQKACESLNIHKPLIVTDPGILKTDIIEKINSSLNTKANIFSVVHSNPTGNNVEL